MISKLFKDERSFTNRNKRFVPFINERNFMGALISDDSKSASRV